MKIAAKKLFTQAVADGKITKTESAKIASAVKKGGVSAAEKAAVRRFVNVHADMFVNSAAKKPLTALTRSASTAAPVANAPTSSARHASIAAEVGNALPNGYGLTPTQKKMLEDSGVNLNTEEGKNTKLQLMMGNYKNNMEMVSNVLKMLTELNAAIIRNIRA